MKTNKNQEVLWSIKTKVQAPTPKQRIATIPADVRDEFNLEKGDDLKWTVVKEDGYKYIILEKME